ncbi:AIG2-like family protein [Legionella massiliensis]|uniref:AIG2-like family protein n=1 Tax=Legionella massiliensis TaxID=1034943 RepID=A0A078L279_9GAMM|nr:gamma-glutamylcyclotransferase family protein [Legionella massiliensis]CDZ78184.1 AIG2-like family protein [Legionella massiliensis]CEE13922.1 AIG2-like family protein [Legionella massiliensis]
MEKLFSYGTLQLPEVQLSSFSRLLEGKKDSLHGYILKDLQITDPHVLQLSGQAVHKILVSTRLKADCVDGMVFELTENELLKADEYEVDDYVRIKVCLASGAEAWVYAHKSELLVPDEIL